MRSTLALLLIVTIAFYVKGNCSNGKDETDYVLKIMDEVVKATPEFIRLPRQLLGEIYLKKGYIKSLENISLGETPVLLFCHNESLGAIQAKFVAENVTFVYEWVYGDDESWGTAIIAPQTIYIDFDIQQSQGSATPNLLGLYVSDFTNTRFSVEIAGGRVHRNEDLFKRQVTLTTKTALLRDAKIIITKHFAVKVEKELHSKVPLQ